MVKKRGVSRDSSKSKANSKTTNKDSSKKESSKNKWHHHVKHHANKIHRHIKKHVSNTHAKIKGHTRKLHSKIIHHFHRRKHIEYEQLPHWKKGMLEFNHRFFGWLMEFIEKAIPWLVLVLLFIIIAELGHDINGLLNNWFHTEWHFLDVMAEFAHNYHYYIVFVDQVIISFFILDLYFNFFKKATSWGFLKTYFLDILAVLPLGFIAGALTKEISTAQSATHVLVDTERIATRTLEAEKIAARSIEAEKVAAETFKFERISRYFKSQRFIRLFTRLPRLLRLYRLSDLFVPNSMKKKSKIKKLTKIKISTNKKTIKKKITIKKQNINKFEKTKKKNHKSKNPLKNHKPKKSVRKSKSKKKPKKKFRKR